MNIGDLNPTPAAEKAFLEWIDQLDQEFMNPDPEHRSDVVRDALHQLYLGRPYAAPRRRGGRAGARAFVRSAQRDTGAGILRRRGRREVCRAQAADLVLDDVRPVAAWD